LEPADCEAAVPAARGAETILNTGEVEEFSTVILVTGCAGIVLVCSKFRTVPVLAAELSIVRIMFSRSPDVLIDDGSM